MNYEDQIPVEERIQVYESMKGGLLDTNDGWYGLCRQLLNAEDRLFGYHFYRGVQGRMFTHYPELWAQKPKKNYSLQSEFWWIPTNKQIRLNAIDRAIEQAKLLLL